MNTFTDWISAWSAAITVGLTFGVLVAALWAASAARDTLAQMKSDSMGQRQDSARATRPYVHARIVPSIAGGDSWDLVIENTGKTAAHLLELEIYAEHVPEDDVTEAVYQFAKAHLTVHPGQHMRSFWTLKATSKKPTGFPSALVTVRYEDSEETPYEERPVLLAPQTLGQTPLPWTGAEIEGKTGDPANTVFALRAIAHHLGEGNR